MKLKGAVTKVSQIEDEEQYYHIVSFPIRVKMEPFEWNETSIDLPMITAEAQPLGTPITIDIQPKFSSS